jgi:acyl dehydratase
MTVTMQPTSITIVASLSDDPHFKGSIHDDSSARTFGYQSALVPGPVVYGYLSQIPIEVWGLDWLEHGVMTSHSRRPVYQGDEITVSASGIEITDEGASMRLTAHNAAGQEVASGEATLPNEPGVAPDAAEFPVIPLLDPPPMVPVEEFGPGRRFGSNPIVMTQAVLDFHLAEFSERWPGYSARGVAHTGYLMRRLVRDSVLSYRHETPGIYVTAWLRHFAVALVGDSLATSGVVTAIYERRGQHYYGSAHLVIANGSKVIAFARRSTIYVVRRSGTA